MTQLFTNNAASALAATITAAETTIALAPGDGAKFPAPGAGDDFLLTLFQRVGTNEVNHEIVRVTARATDSLTVARGQEGTTARAFGSGDPVELRLTAGAILPMRAGALTGALNEAATVTVASAATVAIGTAKANTISITGTTAITGFDTVAAGVVRRTVFAAALTLTHNVTKMILIGNANIATAAGDVAEWLSQGSGVWKLVKYTRADGDSVGTVSLSKGGTGATDAAGAKAALALNNVDNKSSATIRSELTSGNVTTALGYTPYNNTNPSNFITASASITGNAATATKLATARTINGVSFDGTTDITVADGTKLPTSGGTLNGPLTLSSGSDLTLRANGTGDIGDLVYADINGVEKHRVYDGGAVLSYRYNGGTTYTMLHTGNVGTVAPTLTGGGASGNWNISILGGASYATTAGSATTAGAAPWSGITGKPTTIGGYGITDAPTKTGAGASGSWAIDITGNAGKASTLALGGNGSGTLFNWSGQPGQPAWLWGGGDPANMYVYNPSNFSVAYATNAGNASTANSASLIQGYGPSFGSAANSVALRDGNGDLFARVMKADTFSTAPFDVATWNGRSFAHYGISIRDGYSLLSGYNGVAILAGGSERLYASPGGGITVQGNGYFTGDVTAFSDERIKTNWRPVAENFVAKWARVKSGVFDRTDITATQAGLSAQSAQEVLPEVVHEIESRTGTGSVLLSLSYGQAAAVATVELAKKAVDHEQQITDLTGLVITLIERIKELEPK